MWERSHTNFYKNVTKQQIWNLWTDINKWHIWNPDLDYCKMNQPFKVGNTFVLKPSGAPEVKITLIAIEHEKMFTDCTKFLGAKMYGKHEMVEEDGGIILTTTITVVGLLRYLWIKLVAQKIVDKLQTQMDTLVQQTYIQEG